MNASHTPDTEPIKSDTATHTRLRGRWALVARVAWLVWFALLTVMYGLGFLEVREVMSTPCEDEPCTLREQVRHTGAGEEVVNWPGPSSGYADPLRTDQIDALGAVGLTLDGYGWLAALQLGIPTLIFLLIAAGLFWRKSDDWMVLIASVVVATIPTGNMPLAFTLAVRQPAWEWVHDVANTVALSGAGVLYLIFPTGRFVPRWTRWVAVFDIVGAFIIGLFREALFDVPGGLLLIFAYVLSMFVVGGYAQLYRYFRVARPAERQQFKWVVVGLVGYLLTAFFVIFPLQALVNSLAVSIEPALALALSFILDTLSRVGDLFIPISIAVSVLRYRLWDIDFVINRSLAYGVMTLLLGGLFVGAFFGLRALWDTLLGGDQPVIAAVVPAVFVALIFNPTRLRLRGWIDRRLYHINVDYQKGRMPTPSPVAAGRTLATQAGTFEHLEPIGRGGMAEIYRAAHPTTGRPVAIKILPAQLAKEADLRRRFEREARVVAGLKHPNIVRLHDFGESDGTHYMVMEYIAGHDLGEAIRQSAPLPVERVRAILGDIASALDYAHGQGLVHRDIKPSNVMLEPVTREGERAVLMDFGIARIIGGQTRLTATGMMGTFDYMSPEQINDSREVDARADVYALGIMAYQMLTGKLPFTAGSTGALLMLHLRQPPPDPCETLSALPDGVCAAVVRAMDKKPQRRFQSAGEFAAALG